MDMSKVRQEYGAAAAEGDDSGAACPAVVRIALDGKAAAFHAGRHPQDGGRGRMIPDIMVQPLVDGRKLLFRRDGDG